MERNGMPLVRYRKTIDTHFAGFLNNPLPTGPRPTLNNAKTHLHIYFDFYAAYYIHRILLMTGHYNRKRRDGVNNTLLREFVEQYNGISYNRPAINST